MRDLRSIILDVERLEQSAGEKAGLRMRLLDDAALTGKEAKGYIETFIGTLTTDVSDEAKAAAVLGVSLGDAVAKAMKGTK